MADETQQQQAQTENGVDPLILKAALQRLRSEHNLVLAVLAGGAAALLGACVWAAITFATSFQIGWMAVGVGFLVATPSGRSARESTRVSPLWARYGPWPIVPLVICFR